MAEKFDQLKHDQDVDEILRLAVNKSGGTSDLRARLETSAAELGISPDALAEAENEYFVKKQAEQEERAAKIKRRRTFVEHFGSYVSVNLMLIAIWYFTSRGGSFWPIWPLMGWGLFGVLPHFINAVILNKDREDDEAINI